MEPCDHKYEINGEKCSELEYVSLVKNIFNRTTPDVDHVFLQNDETVTLGGNLVCVSILHHRNDGTVWSMPEGRINENDVILLYCLRLSFPVLYGLDVKVFR